MRKYSKCGAATPCLPPQIACGQNKWERKVLLRSQTRHLCGPAQSNYHFDLAKSLSTKIKDQSRNICHLTFRFSVLKMCGILLLRIQQRHLHQQLLPNSKASLAAGVKISWQLLHSIAVEELCNFYNQRWMETVGSCELHEVGWVAWIAFICSDIVSLQFWEPVLTLWRWAEWKSKSFHWRYTIASRNSWQGLFINIMKL